MVSLWGSKNKDDDHPPREEDEDDTEATTSQPQPNRRPDDANERTRLLPRNERGLGYLSPDDPAVCSGRWQVELSGIWLMMRAGIAV
jgi:hypothetical protein